MKRISTPTLLLILADMFFIAFPLFYIVLYNGQTTELKVTSYIMLYAFGIPLFLLTMLQIVKSRKK